VKIIIIIICGLSNIATILGMYKLGQKSLCDFIKENQTEHGRTELEPICPEPHYFHQSKTFSSGKFNVPWMRNIL
jgi:hypothetical protein